MRLGSSPSQPATEPPRGARMPMALALGVGLLLILLGAALRVYFQHIPNFSPVAAIALYAGFWFRRVWRAALVPLGAMLLSDAVIGGYDPRLMLTVYGMLALPVLAGAFVLRRDMAWRYRFGGALAFSLLASLLFFVVTNSAVWAFSIWYTQDIAGWMQCLTAGLPFVRYTLSGDLVFATVLFGGHACAATIWSRRHALASVASR